MGIQIARFDVQLHFLGPLLSEASGARAYGIDSSFLRYRGQPVLSGSLVRGCLRHSLADFVKVLPPKHSLRPDMARWFGTHYTQDEGTDDGAERQSGAASFDFMWLAKGNQAANTLAQSTRTRISIAESGTVSSGMLQVIETPFASGQEVTVSGAIELGYVRDDEPDRFKRWIEKACDYTTAMGALKGVGFGRLQGVTVSRVRVDSVQIKPVQPEYTDRLSLEIRLDRPLLIAGTGPVRGNRVVSESFIRGAVLKGAFAQMHKDLSDTNAAQQFIEDFDFDRLVFKNALPFNDDESGLDAPRYGPIPLSLGVAELADGKTLLAADLAAFRHALVIIEHENKCSMKLAKYVGRARIEASIAPFKFGPSWKRTHRDAVNRLNAGIRGPRGDLERFMVVRTAIQQGTNVADEDRLFSQQCVDAEGLVWRTDIDLSNVDAAHRERVTANLCAAFAQGIAPIGKTRAIANITVRKRASKIKDRWKAKDPTFTVLLRSPARLFGTPQVDGGASGATVLRDLYKDYWSHASDGLLALGHYFARQDRLGGRFHARKFRGKDRDYRPEWLTQAGSVFVLQRDSQAKDAKIQKLLREWARLGLPSAADRSNDNWATDPYRRENGYGEVEINHVQVGIDKLPKLDGKKK